MEVVAVSLYLNASSPGVHAALPLTLPVTSIRSHPDRVQLTLRTAFRRHNLSPDAVFLFETRPSRASVPSIVLGTTGSFSLNKRLRSPSRWFLVPQNRWDVSSGVDGIFRRSVIKGRRSPGAEEVLVS
ncbi:hypothetical protein CC78DRAFT_57712 [Lojkania enalia]|uniref:Uncharacterized protein n=1 Tax=Lojkania enalia TaxID=147567 RepID=A0A9P4K140_9PLEO|nr:hypothetical protein CC78DRAFT_57712 [Didymosphaeria enalia]